VAARSDVADAAVWLTARDDTFWVFDNPSQPSVNPRQEPNPDRLGRIAAASNDDVWCISVDGALWRRGADGTWIQASTQHHLTDVVEDVTVAADNTVWIAARDGTIWTTQDGATFTERTAIVGFKRLAAGPHGELWGISADASLWRMTPNGWFLTNGRDMEDVSVSFEGTIWLVARDGTVLTTTDGNDFLRMGSEGGFVSLSAGQPDGIYATKADGTFWTWIEESPGAGGGGGGGGRS
jgi:Tectonin domain